MNKPAFTSRNTKISKVGNSAAIILPKDVLANLRAEIGDDITMMLEGGSIILKPVDQEFDEEMQVARDVMRRRKKSLRELAK